MAKLKPSKLLIYIPAAHESFYSHSGFTACTEALCFFYYQWSKDKENTHTHTYKSFAASVSASGIDFSTENPYIVFSLIIMHQINSEGINHHERHGSSWGEKLLNLTHKIPLIEGEDCCENASS